MSEEITRGINIESLEAADSRGPSGANHLLVIAIDEYEHCPVLNNCLQDALGFIEILKERYDFSDEHILTLYNKEATRANIHARLKELKKRVQPEDSLLIYFSGHGETEDNVGYWVPVEAHPDREWEFVSTNDIKSRLDAINSFHTFVIVDACFSGALFASYRSVKAGNENRRSRLGLAASHSRERALDGTAGENSPFSQNLLRKLRENTGLLSAHKLAAELIEEVHAATRGKQTPVFKPLDVKGDDSGQFVFRLKADEGRDWKDCQQKGTLAAYEAFLAKYPEGQHAAEAQEQLVLLRDEAAWEAAREEHTAGAYFRYRQENPDGRYRDEALQAIQQVEEDQSWHQAQRKNTIYQYEHYLEKYPAGRYAQDAQDALQALLGGQAPAVKPTAAEPQQKAPPPKVEPARQEPKVEKPTPPPARPAEVKVEKAGPAVKQESAPRPAPTIDRKHLMIGGGVLAVLILVIWGIMAGGGSSPDPAALEVFSTTGKYGYRDG
ncbi:MAG: caspase family protein, partial [Lewinellaceae bacterium]|nr:caspase family protein [Lewinellaceae bacterium]